MSTPILTALAQFVNDPDGSDGWLFTRANARALLEEIKAATPEELAAIESAPTFRSIRDSLPKQRVSGL